MSKTMNHAEYKAACRQNTSAGLRAIIADCFATLRAWGPDHPNEGYYLDEISYCGMELKRRGEA